MLQVLRNSWALLLGITLLMLGNGMQGTLLGIRGGIEGIPTLEMSVVMSSYFLGFLFGSRLTPKMIRRVGHVRVFAALASLISAVIVMYAVAPNWIAWSLERVVIGFSFSGVYITSESWLNNASTNANRGKALSLYVIMQMLGIIAAQTMLNFGDPAGYMLFIIPSVLVSVSFTPILLSVSPAPAFEATATLSFRRLFAVSPLGFVAMFLLGGVFSAQFGMAAVWGTSAGLTVRQLSIFVAMIYVGGLIFQYPIGWLSDRIDRRRLILALAAVGALAALAAVVFTPGFAVLVGIAVIGGGVSNPLYSLLVAYVNDYLEGPDMAAASAGLIFINGLGAITGPLITGWMMARIGPPGFFLFQGLLYVAMAAYAAWRMTRRRHRSIVEAPAGFTALSPTSSALAVGAQIEASQHEAHPEAEAAAKAAE